MSVCERKRIAGLLRQIGIDKLEQIGIDMNDVSPICTDCTNQPGCSERGNQHRQGAPTKQAAGDFNALVRATMRDRQCNVWTARRIVQETCPELYANWDAEHRGTLRRAPRR